MIEAVSLDETVYDKKPTFIKMDIEGSGAGSTERVQENYKGFSP